MLQHNVAHNERMFTNVISTIRMSLVLTQIVFVAASCLHDHGVLRGIASGAVELIYSYTLNVDCRRKLENYSHYFYF